MDRSRIIVENLQIGFKGGLNRTYKQRLNHLKQLEKLIRQNERYLIDAVHTDFQKPDFETLLTEFMPVYMEIKHFKKKLKEYMRNHDVHTPWMMYPASGEIHYEPKGVVFIIGAWNYPINLTLIPLIGAIAAGNTVLLKPSEIASNTSTMLARLINQTFDERIIKVVEGGADVTQEYLQEKYDHIFYTGSTHVGKIIYEQAAKQLTPVTLELGGKSPVVVDVKTNLKKTVKRILWGKYVNAGQTCVAPDYLFFPRSLKGELLKIIPTILAKFDMENSTQGAHIINEKHFDRLLSYLDENTNYLHQGTHDRASLWMSLHVVEIESLDHPLLKEEIFGPILPVIFYDDYEEFYEVYEHNPNPLAFYIYSKKKKFADFFIENFAAGGVLVNDCLMHLGHEELPFGGRGNSGFGNYHGFASFACFSHAKSVMRQKFWLKPFYRYPKYTAKRMRFLRKIMKRVG